MSNVTASGRPGGLMPGTDASVVYHAIEHLARGGRAANYSQIAARTLLSRNRVREAARWLAREGLIADHGKGAAPHWRATGLLEDDRT